MADLHNHLPSYYHVDCMRINLEGDRIIAMVMFGMIVATLFIAYTIGLNLNPE